MAIFSGALFLTLLLYKFPQVKIGNKKINIYMISSFLLLVIMGGIRFDVGEDFSSYYIHFLKLDFLTPSHWIFEPGYEVFNNIIYNFFGNPQSIIFFTNLLILILAYLSINTYSFDKNLSVFLFIFGFFYFDSLNVIRQYISILLVLWGHKFLFSKKNKFILIVLLATTFHFSAIFSLLMIPLYNFRIKKKHLLYIYSFVLLFNVFSQYFINFIFTIISRVPFLSQYTIYQETFKSDLSSTPYDFLVYSLILFLSLWFVKKEAKSVPSFYFYQSCLAVVVILKGMALSYKFFDRISAIFSIFLILLLPIILKNLKTKERKYVKISILFFFVIYCFVRIISGQAGVLDYQIFS